MWRYNYFVKFSRQIGSSRPRDQAVKFDTWQHSAIGTRVRFSASGSICFICLYFL